MKSILSLLLIFILLSALLLCQENSGLTTGKIKMIQSGFSFTEGPAVNERGDVYFTDQPNNKIYKWNCETNEITVFHESPERANGTYFDSQGNLIACADLHGRLISINKNGDYQVLLDGLEGKQFNGPNDLWIEPKGGIYFTDPYYQRPYWERTEPEIEEERVYYLSTNGSVTIVDNELVKPNGIIGTLDGKYLYVADIGESKTYRYKINTDGTLTNKTLFAEEGSDGMTIDNAGNVYLTNDYVSIFDSTGKSIAKIEVPERPSNVCFGGKERDILFITARTSVYKLQMNVRGAN